MKFVILNLLIKILTQFEIYQIKKEGREGELENFQKLANFESTLEQTNELADDFSSEEDDSEEDDREEGEVVSDDKQI